MLVINYSKKILALILGLLFSLALLLLLALLSNIVPPEIKNRVVHFETVAIMKPPKMQELIQEQIKQEELKKPEIQELEMQKPLEIKMKQIPIQLDVNMNPSDVSLKLPKFRLDKQDFEMEDFTAQRQLRPIKRVVKPRPKPVKKITKKAAPKPKIVKKIVAKPKPLPPPKNTFKLGELDERPRLLNKASISFPRALRARGIKLVEVKVLVQINTRGKVKFIKFTKPLQYKVLEKPLKRFIKRSLFTTPTKNGKPVNAQFIWPIKISRG